MSTEHEDTPARQETLLAELRCYYAEDPRRLERPDCRGVAVVAYGNIALCSMCDVMRSAVGRTNSARKLPGAELNELIDAARALALAERRVNETVQSARMAEASWGQVGDALGTSRQAAQQRFAGVVLSSSTAAQRP